MMETVLNPAWLLFCLVDGLLYGWNLCDYLTSEPVELCFELK